MSIVRLASIALAAASLCSAATPRAIASKVEATLQGKTRMGIVCNYSMTKDQIAEIVANLDPAIRVTVVDTRSPDNMDNACHILQNKQVDCLLLLPWDPHFSTKAHMGKRLVNRISQHGIPVIQTDNL